jgi:hypothetical protein
MQDNDVYWIWNYVLTGSMGVLVAALMFFLMRDSPSEPPQKQQDL